MTAKYARADLPPLLEFLDGTPVRTMDDWKLRKKEIRRLMCEYFIGTFPQTVPAIIGSEVLEEMRKDDGSIRRRVRLTFDTPNKVSFEMWLWIPTGDGPFPVILNAPVKYQIPWAQTGVERGYLVCLYPGVDSHDDEKDFPGFHTKWEEFQAEYPHATWSEIATKAWLAGRALDYLLDERNGCDVIADQVGIIGFSRHAKQSLLAGAFDPRITAVLARSAGSPGSCPYRLTSRHTFAETPSDFPYLFPHVWFLPSLQRYAGRENELPIDAHGWLGLIAPRRCQLHTAYHDGGDPTFAVERTYLEGKTVYRFLGRPENLLLRYRTGCHGPITDEHREDNYDWFDMCFGRGTARQKDFPEELVHHFDWPAWKANLSVDDLKIPFAQSRAGDDPDDKRACIRWALGQAPHEVKWDGKYRFLTAGQSAMMNQPPTDPDGVVNIPVVFGENVHGNIYHNPHKQPWIKGPKTLVIWLHPYSYQKGYVEDYGIEGMNLLHRLAEGGSVVLAFNQVGFGLRLLEGRDFYRQYPKWSRLGRMVHDLHSAVDFLIDGKGESVEPLPDFRRDQIVCLGYSMGGMLGLLGAALDNRINAVASFCGFTPLRTDTDAKPTGGTRKMWEWHALQPLLGLFNGHEQDTPYDFDDVLSLIAPRMCLIEAPVNDRLADFDEVAACVDRAREAWRAKRRGDALSFITPNDYNRFQANQQGRFQAWLNRLRERWDSSAPIT